jgi:predicted nucleic acid-binding protein
VDRQESIVIVLDSSALIDSFLRLDCAERLKHLVETEGIASPELIYPETLQALRKMERLGDITTIFGERCVSVLRSLPIKRFTVAESAWNIWGLRHNFTAYDASYVVLAGNLNAKLVTHDIRLSKAAVDHIDVMDLFDPAP